MNSYNLTQDDIKQTQNYVHNLLQKTSAANIKCFNDSFVKLSTDETLDEKEISELESILNRFSLDINQIATFNDFLDLKYLCNLNQGKLLEHKTELILKKDEVCYYFSNCSLVEEKTDVQFVGAYSGISVKIVKGVYYKIGGSKGRRIENVHNEISDNGNLFITNKRIIFISERKNFTYKVDDIIDLKIFQDAIAFVTEKQSKLKYFTFKDSYATEVITKVLSLMNK